MNRGLSSLSDSVYEMVTMIAGWLFFDDTDKKLDDAGSNKPPHGKKKGKQDNKAKSGQRYAGYFRYWISADAGDKSSDEG